MAPPIVRTVLFGFVLLAVPAFGASSVNSCRPVTADSIALVNVAFSYKEGKNPIPPLPVLGHQEVFSKGMATKLGVKGIEIHDTPTGPTKAEFIEAFAAGIAGKPYVVLNMLMHGIPLPVTSKDGTTSIQWAFMLPGEVTDPSCQAFLTSYCQELEEKMPPPGPKAPDSWTDALATPAHFKEARACEKFLVTAAELGELLKGKEVIGSIESCHSGGAKRVLAQNLKALIQFSSSWHEPTIADNPPESLLFAYRKKARFEEGAISLLSSGRGSKLTEKERTKLDRLETVVYGDRKRYTRDERDRLVRGMEPATRALALEWISLRNRILEQEAIIARDTPKLDGPDTQIGQAARFFRDRSFAKADRNHDGKVTLEEYYGGLPGVLRSAELEQHPVSLDTGSCTQGFLKYPLAYSADVTPPAPAGGRVAR